MAEARFSPQRNVAGFVLQANPAKFAIDAYLSRQDFVYFRFPLFNEDAQLGMPVFIKRTGPEGGLVARGVIAELPRPEAELAFPHLRGEDLWVTPDASDTAPRAGVQIEELRLSVEEGMLPTGSFREIPELTGHPLIEAPRGTVLRLSPTHLAALMREWGTADYSGAALAGAAVSEGERKLRTHYRAERKQRIIAEKKRQFLEQHGRLFCEACRGDFDAKYGELWNERAIEGHHIVPLSQCETPVVTRVEDLILLCSTCHALVHQSSDVEGNLRKLLKRFGGAW